jgi:hypothetical protein
MLATAPVYALQNQDNKQQETAPKAPDRGDKPADKPAREPANKPPERPVDKPAKPSEKPPATESSRRQEDQQQQKQAQQQQKAQQNEAKTQQKQAKNQRKQQQTERQTANRPHDQNRGQVRPAAANAPRGNERGGRIPEDRYRADFGRAHTFHVRHDNDRRFEFGGFSFQYTDAWPSDWGNNDDFYVVEIDGVDYLCDARYPDQRIVVVVVS